MTDLGMIRHAKTSWNQKKKLQGRHDIALSEQGIQQARSWGERLQQVRFDLILSSPMIRARQTSRIIAELIHLDIEYDDNLREQDFGEWEGKTLRDIKKESPGEVEFQESKGWGFCPPGGESRRRVLKRGLSAVTRAKTKFKGQKLLVVTHNSVMKTLIYHILGKDFSPEEPSGLKACHLHVMSWEKKWIIRHLNHIKL